MERRTDKDRDAEQNLAQSQARLREAHAEFEKARDRLADLPDILAADQKAADAERAKAQQLRDEAALRRKKERESGGLE